MTSMSWDYMSSGRPGNPPNGSGAREDPEAYGGDSHGCYQADGSWMEAGPNEPVFDLDVLEEEGQALVSDTMTYFNGDTIPAGVPYTLKSPPVWDGIASWFTYWQNVRNWEDQTTIEKEKRGPMLRDRLTGLAKSEWRDDLNSDEMRSKLTSK